MTLDSHQKMVSSDKLSVSILKLNNFKDI